MYISLIGNLPTVRFEPAQILVKHVCIRWLKKLQNASSYVERITHFEREIPTWFRCVVFCKKILLKVSKV